ncbi:MFS transporter [Streptomyces sp. VRA16 Mangrove soil]|uniref:MFS transporter n=1 Tax=Streptomyces sp. VRA16 Mangrove soil TaxID=2817434 RepID=UPI001A9EFBF5|nr:MFS transporter [Streptomyces sp. VRA16 Mangrove soil]MBO1333459.1 MFS transporter [Streptomyces sp. VRA16 Mangrove soil]
MTLAPLTAGRRYSAVSFLFWLPTGLSIPVQVLLLTERGVSLAAISALFAVHSLTAAALELPTGGLSDVLGRRAVLAASGVLTVVALALIATGTAVWVLVVAMALKGTARALNSGPAEAWYVDTVHAHEGPDAELRTGLARGAAAGAAALAIGTLCGGLGPWLLGLGSDPGARFESAVGVPVLALPLLVGAVISVFYVGYVCVALPEPPRPATTLRQVIGGIPATVTGGIRHTARDGLVRRVVLTAAATGSALGVVELLTPGRAADLSGTADGGAVLYAALSCAGFCGTAFGNRLAPLAARLTGSGERAVLTGECTAVLGLLLLCVTAATDLAALAALGYLLVYVGLGATGPNVNEFLHRRTDSSARATVLSVQSLALQLAGAVFGMIAGALPAGAVAWLPGVAGLVAGALLWTRRAPAAPPASTPVPRTENQGATAPAPSSR